MPHGPATRTQRRRLPRRAALACLVAWLAVAPDVVTAADDALSVDELKAAYLFNFAKFVEWPAQAAGTPLRICVFGRDTLAAPLSALDGKEARGRTVRVLSSVTLDQATSCDLLFVTRSEERRLRTVLQQVAGRPVVTVSDIERFAAEGGAVEFVNSSGKLRFDINLDVLRQAGLKVSSQLLGVARTVMGAPR
jgi:hypothetical protein